MNTARKTAALWVFAYLLVKASVFAEDATNITYEAEEADNLYGVDVKTTIKGFAGAGYADYGGAGSYVEWTKVFAGEGAATLVFQYANGAHDDDRPTKLFINDVHVETIEWTRTGAWEIWQTKDVKVELQRGKNVIKLVQIRVGGPNIDQMVVIAKPVAIGTIPKVAGLNEADAAILIKSAGMSLGTVTTEFSTSVAPGRVIRQEPEALSEKPQGYPVDLVISQGPPVVG